MIKRRGRPPGPDSIYGEVASDIQRRIAQKEWAPGKALPSTRTLSRHYNLSQRSICRALQQLAEDGQILIRPRRRPIVAFDTSFKETMDGSIAAVMNVGLWNMLRSEIYKPLFDGIAQAVQKARIPLLILQDGERWREEFPAGLCQLPVSGVILFGSSVKPAVLRCYEDLGKPVVLVDQPGDGWKFSSVAADNFKAAFDTANRLFALGHRNIALMRYLNYGTQAVDPDDKERIAGFLAAARNVRSANIKVFSLTRIRPTSVITQILKAEPRFTAVMARSVVLAEQLAADAQARGLQIPRDLSIVTFRTAVALSSDWSGPLIDFEAMARQAVDLILQRPATIRHVRIATRWNPGVSIASVK